MLINEIGANLVSDVIWIDYTKNQGQAFGRVAEIANISKMQTITELACKATNTSFEAISGKLAKEYADQILPIPKDKLGKEDEYIVTEMAKYYKKAKDTSGHKSVRLYSPSNIKALKDIDAFTKDTYLGIVYAIQYGDTVKIGSTKYPHQRFMTLKNQAENYGNVKIGNMAISDLHTNFRENERVAHRKFEIHRQEGTELFNISFETAASYLNELTLLDETAKLAKEAEDIKNGMAYLLFGGGLSECIKQS